MDSHIKKIGLDKITHITTSFMTVVILHTFIDNLPFAAGLTFAIGFIKEMADSWNKTFNYKDIIANLIGIIIYILLKII